MSKLPRATAGPIRGRVRAHDPFELIRWLAMSQPDPRKALAELVQNSLDAGAKTVRIIRARAQKRPVLRIFDDGSGVIPDMTRPEALRYIATHIGHSRKRALSPEERFKLMTQGQYGIGLLGFWSIGTEMEIRSAVPEQSAMALRLTRDSPEFEIDDLRGRLPLEDRWTEVVISGIHDDALAPLGGRRASEYLASELRGQLLGRDVELVIEDRLARGRAQKVFAVRPPKFLGERIPGLGPVAIEGHPPIEVEVYFANEEAESVQALSVYAAGTLVAESFHELANIDLDHAPWTDSRLCGLIDFPALSVSPGSRRRVVPNEATSAFKAGLGQLAPALHALLDSRETERSAAVDRTLVRDLRRAFRDFFSQRPELSLLPVAEKGNQIAALSDSIGEGELLSIGGSDESTPLMTPEDELEEGEPTELPGPLYAVAISPTPIRVERGGSRRLRARPVDQAGRPIRHSVDFAWSVDDSVGRLDPTVRQTVTLLAHDGVVSGELSVTATEAGRSAHAQRRVDVVEALAPARAGAGVPAPTFVHDRGAGWRSRVVDGRWEVNSGHREYRELADRPALKLRYVAMLFAKEVVIRSRNDTRLEQPLEELIEIAAYADRHASRRPRKRRDG